MKFRITETRCLIYEPVVSDYPHCKTPEQMLALDLKNARRDSDTIFLAEDGYPEFGVETTITAEILPEGEKP